MSEVLLLAPAELQRESASSIASFTATSNHPSLAAIFTRRFTSPCARLGSVTPSLSTSQAVDGERLRRLTLEAEYALSHVGLMEWHRSIRDALRCEEWRRRTADVALQESVLQFRMERFTFWLQRQELSATSHVSLPDGSSSGADAFRLSFEFLTQKESSAREAVTMDEMQARVPLWSSLAAIRPSGVSLLLPVLDIAGNETSEGVWRRRVRRMRREAAHVREEAEALSFTLDEDVTAVRSPRSKRLRALYPVAVMRAAVEFIDRLRREMYNTSKQHHATRRALRVARRELMEQKKRTAALQQLVDAAEGFAAETVTMCGLQIHWSGAPESSSPAVQQQQQQQKQKQLAQEGVEETYTARVMRELRQSVLTLRRQLEWQEARAGRDLKDREATLRLLCDQSGKLALLLQQQLGPAAPAMLSVGESGGVHAGNVAAVLEGAIAAVVTMRDGDSSGFLAPNTTSVGGGKEKLPRWIQHAASPGRAGNRKDPVEEIDALTMALRRLEEVRAEKLALEQQMENRRDRRLPCFHTSNNSNPGASMHVGSSMTRNEVHERTGGEWVQVVHRLRESNTLLEQELRLERGAKESLATQLKGAERFVRELQRQCRLLRQGGRKADSYEVIEADSPGSSSGEDSDDVHEDDPFDGEFDEDEDAYDEEDKDEDEGGNRSDHNESDNYEDEDHPRKKNTAAFPTKAKRDDGGVTAHDTKRPRISSAIPFHEAHRAEEYYSPPVASNQTPSLASSLTNGGTSVRGAGAESVSSISETDTSTTRAEHRACLLDQRRLTTSLHRTHGLTVGTIALRRAGLHRMLAGCCLSFHAFPRTASNIAPSRCVAILYALPAPLSRDLPPAPVVARIRRAAAIAPRTAQKTSGDYGGSNETSNSTHAPGTELEVVDLRQEFPSASQFVRGCMDVSLSYDGRFMYVLASANADVVARLCSPACLGIPPECRFRFAAATEDVFGVTASMDTLGWCGRGVCAWGMDALRFESTHEQERFERHLREEYSLVLRLNAHELRRLVGGSVELMARRSNGRPVRRLFMSVGAFDALTLEHRTALLEWYGGAHGLAVLAIAGVERAAVPLRRLMAVSYWHGETAPTRTPPQGILERFGIQINK